MYIFTRIPYCTWKITVMLFCLCYWWAVNDWRVVWKYFAAAVSEKSAYGFKANRFIIHKKGSCWVVVFTESYIVVHFSLYYLDFSTACFSFEEIVRYCFIQVVYNCNTHEFINVCLCKLDGIYFHIKSPFKERLQQFWLKLQDFVVPPFP